MDGSSCGGLQRVPCNGTACDAGLSTVQFDGTPHTLQVNFVASVVQSANGGKEVLSGTGRMQVLLACGAPTTHCRRPEICHPSRSLG